MSSPKATKRGRPLIAAQSLDEALANVYNGKAPKRARNAYEQQAQSKGRNGKRGGGRRPDPSARTNEAAQLAVYLKSYEQISLTAAARKAAQQWGANPDNVRKRAAEIYRGPQVRIRAEVPTWVRGLTGSDFAEELRPLVHRVVDVDQHSPEDPFGDF